MSIPPNSTLRGCAANFRQPVNEDDERRAQRLVQAVQVFNCDGRYANPPLANIMYRSSSREEDILRHVYRWDLTPYQEVFQNGFQARPQQNTTDGDYYNLDHHVHHAGRPLVSDRHTPDAFVSTTLNCNYNPYVSDTVDEICRYEIFAPGGIWVAQTLGDRYQYPSQDEVCFVAGIAPQYIRSAQRFRLIVDGRFTRRERLENVIIVNGYNNPQSHPPRLLNIRRPIFDYQDTNGTRRPLTIRIWRPSERQKREAEHSNTTQKREAEHSPTDWYAGGVANCESYINAAFRSSRRNEAYLFMTNEYVLINYAPGSADDRMVNGPLLLCEGFPSLTGTAFAEHGIDCAFGSYDQDEAYIFSGNLCAQINYAPGTTDDKIIKGPMTITAMFPFLKYTEFASGVDAAFESTRKYEAYLFKDDQYALINYGSNDPHLLHVHPIRDGFPSLKNTIFETGIEAAFASSRTDEAYLFKGDSYALINFAPGTTNDRIIGGVKKIHPNWPSLQTILPCRNRGIDVHNHTNTGPDKDNRDHNDRDHDEL